MENNNQLSQREVWEYSVLAQQCYATSKSEIKLPKGWAFIIRYNAKHEYDTACTVYINGNRKEVVVGIRGSATLSNWITDGQLALNEIMDRQNVPNGYYAVKEFLKGEGFNDYADMADDLQDLLKNLSTYCSTVEEGANKEVQSRLQQYQESSAATDIAIVPMNREDLLTKFLQGLLELKFDLTKDLRKLTKIIKDNGFELKVIGHSLGGFLAQLLAVEMGVRCVTFESPGSLGLLKEHPRFKDLLESSSRGITNYFGAPNVINTFGEHPGSSYRMFLPLNPGFLVADIAAPFATTAGIVYCVCEGKFGKAFVAVAGIGALISVVVHAIFGGLWLNRQHSIDIIVKYLSGEYGEVRIVLIQANSWPLKVGSSKWVLPIIDEVFRKIRNNVIEPPQHAAFAQKY